MIITLNDKTYRVSPTGLVWAGYTRPSQNGSRMIWKPMGRHTALTKRVLIAAGLAAPEPTPMTRRRFHHYAEVHTRRRYYR